LTVTNALALYGAELITYLKRFIEQVSRSKFFVYYFEELKTAQILNQGGND
jgi:hypothetical protein